MDDASGESTEKDDVRGTGRGEPETDRYGMKLTQ